MVMKKPTRPKPPGDVAGGKGTVPPMGGRGSFGKVGGGATGGRPGAGKKPMPGPRKGR